MEIPHVVTPRKDTGLFNSKIAIWLFLASEVMLFGGFFSAYVFLRLGADYPWPERTLPVLPGLINTFILIASSVTVVFAWAALKMRQWVRFQIFMGITVLCAAVFMCFKGLEYSVKFHHQAVRLDDYSVVEGHTAYETVGGHDDHADHGAEGDHAEKHEEYLVDVDGKKIEFNHHRFATKTFTFDLSRFHKPWVDRFLREAAAAGVEVKLMEDIDFNRAGAEQDADEVFQAGTPLTVDLLERIAAEQLENRAFNAEWRTKFLRKAWAEKMEEIEENDLFGEGAFAAEFPKGLELDAAERRKAYARWKAGKRARLATEVDLTKATLKKDGEIVRYADVELPEKPTASFEASQPILLRFDSHQVISAFNAAANQLVLRDGTTLGGGYEDSPLVLHYVDALDFRHVAMMAEERGQEPLAAIENSWLIRENPEIAAIWQKHLKAVGQLEAELAKKGKVPTIKDRYRIDWASMVYYVKTDLEDVKVEEGAISVPHEDRKIIEEFKGPDYETRHFPHLSIPRERVMLDSKFTPKWNTYYAIYFTITGLHGLHVIGGAIVLAYYLFFGKKMYLTNPEWLANRVEVGGLFWHFVDLVWIFAFPIFYLM